VPQSYYFCIKNALKLTYDHLYFKKKFLGSLSLAMKGRDTTREGRGGERRGGERRGRRQRRERKGRGGEGRGGGGEGDREL
jgi:hypothetical protein